METVKITLKAFLACVTVFIIAEAVAGQLLSNHLFPELAVVGLTRLIQIAATIYIFHKQPAELAAIGLKSGQLLPGLIRGLMWSVGFGFIVLIAAGVIHLNGINPIRLIQMQQPEDTMTLCLLFIVGGLIGPVAEEIFFRGLLYEFLRHNVIYILDHKQISHSELFGILIALTLSNLVFVFLHSMVSPIQVIGGLLFTVAYEKEKKLMVPIVIHVLGNTAIFTVAQLNHFL